MRAFGGGHHLHAMALVMWVVVVGVPTWRIVKRTGHDPFVALLSLVPVVNIVFLWWLAFSHWPRVDGGRGERG
jgi:hypothetical protein